MNVGLFIPCYVDTVFPEVGSASYKLLKHLGVNVTYPAGQTCCGQPMGNAGYEKDAEKLAHRFNDIFKGFDYVVAPSVSCSAFVRFNYPRLLDQTHRCELAEKTMDIIEFLYDVLKVNTPLGRFPYKVSVHNSCHGVRELYLSSPSEMHVEKFNKIIDLLKLVDGIEITEPERPDECCGFGGMFSIEETAVSTRLGQNKLKRHIATGADYITGADCSCLMHLAGIASKRGEQIQFKHAVEILAAGL